MSEWTGFLLVVGAGVATGVQFLGLKYAAPWKWENIWLAYAVFALLVLPFGMAIATVPRLAEVLSNSPGGHIWRVALYGAGWGIGSVLSGLGVVRMGMALGISVLIGVDAAVGAFVPMAIDTPDVVLQTKGLMVIGAVLTMILGVALVGVAGKKREGSPTVTDSPLKQESFAVGLVICVFSGIFSAMMNFAFAFSLPISQVAVCLGSSESGALNVVWLVALIGGFIPTGLYTGYLLTCNKTWGLYLQPRTGRLWLVGLGMAIVWYIGLLFYGWGAAAMGRLGAVIGWPLFMAVLILASNVLGFLTGEWKGASKAAKHWMAAGLGILMIASALLGIANQD